MYRIGIAPKPSDVGHIRALVSRIQHEKRRVRFREQLETLITPELFEARDAQASSREQAIDVLAETLERNGFVQPGYAGEIWERENLSATRSAASQCPMRSSRTPSEAASPFLFRPLHSTGPARA